MTGNISHKANIGVVFGENACSHECCVLCSGLHMANLCVDNPCWWLIKSDIRACGQDDRGWRFLNESWVMSFMLLLCPIRARGGW